LIKDLAMITAQQNTDGLPTRPAWLQVEACQVFGLTLRRISL